MGCCGSSAQDKQPLDPKENERRRQERCFVNVLKANPPGLQLRKEGNKNKKVMAYKMEVELCIANCKNLSVQEEQ